MTDRRILARRFETERPRLKAIAARLLSSEAEADDVVQEAWLRLERVDVDAIENLQAWLTTVVSRLSLDVLRAPRRGTDRGRWNSGATSRCPTEAIRRPRPNAATR
jgi:RNA polymerase sigma-70 factor (ECF subfamily)